MDRPDSHLVSGNKPVIIRWTRPICQLCCCYWLEVCKWWVKGASLKEVSTSCESDCRFLYFSISVHGYINILNMGCFLTWKKRPSEKFSVPPSTPKGFYSWGQNHSYCLLCYVSHPLNNLIPYHCLTHHHTSHFVSSNISSHSWNFRLSFPHKSLGI